MYYLRLATLTCVGGFRLVACLTSLAEVVHLPRYSTAASKLIGLSQPSPQGFLAPGSRQRRQLTRETKEQDEPAIVIFGQLLLPDGSATKVLRLRVKKAAEVFENAGPMPIIVSGGDPQNRGITEAQVMQNLLVALGVPEGAVVLETESNNTLQNALNVLDNYGEEESLLPSACKRLMLVTSTFHMPRCAYLFEAVLVYYGLNSTIALERIPVAGGCPEFSDVKDIKDPGVNQMTLLQRLEQERYYLSNIEYFMQKDAPVGITVQPLPESRKEQALAVIDAMIDKAKQPSNSSSAS
mmetsp:Transcript_154983/g.274812  ORF Transcript_154983/g.274812 Transcript_154983/m.274812 type:complete len:296 (-) Transcript_154983:78-965(-)